MTNSISRHKAIETTFQIAFVSTVIALIVTLAMVILASLLPNQLFASGGISILPQYGDGTWNVSLVTGFAILVIYFVIYLLPALIGLRNSSIWSQRLLYIFIPIALVYLIVSVFVVPLLNSRVPNLQGNFYPVVVTLTAAASYLACSHPLIANRADRKKTQQQKTGQ